MWSADAGIHTWLRLGVSSVQTPNIGLRRHTQECLQAPDRWSYSDLAIAPPREDELDSLELFSATRGGEMAVAKKRKEDAARTAVRPAAA